MNNSTSDHDFLNNYIRFAAVHRWRVANACFEHFLQTDDKSPERAHLALEIFFCYLLLMEDILMWYYVLKGFQTPPNANLMDSLDAVKLSPDRRKTALEEMERISMTGFMTLLGFSQKHNVLQSKPLTEQYGIPETEIAKLKEALTGGIKTFLQGDGDFWKQGILVQCLNKIKHGLLVMRTCEDPSDPESVAIFPDGRRSDDAVPCVTSDETSSRMILSQIVRFTVVLVGMLTTVFETRFGCSPHGEPPEGLVRSFKNGCGLDKKSGGR